MPRQPILSVLGHVDSGKCVAPDTKIQLSSGSKITAEKLFKKYSDNGKRLKDEEGEVYELENGPEVFGASDGDIVECEVENIWKLEKDRLLDFKLKDGSEISVTPEHPFLVVEDSELVFKEAEKLESSDFVAVSSKLPVQEEDLTDLKIRTLEKLGNSELILAFTNEEFSAKLYEKGKNIENQLLTNYLNDCKRSNRFRLQDIITICEHSSINLEEAYKNIEQVKQAVLEQRAGTTSNKIELPSTFSDFEDLAYCVGLMLGDGNREATKLYNNSNTIRQEFIASVENSVGTTTSLNKYEEKVDEVYIECGKTLSKFFEILFEFPIERKSHSIKISNFAAQMPKNILGNLISGYFDADGYANKKGSISITSASEDMIDSLKSALKRFNISAYTSKKNGYHILHISGKENLQRFAEIGFRKPEKQERLEQHIKKSKSNPVTGLTPVKGSEIREARLELGANHTEIDIPYQKKYENYEHVSRSYLQKFAEEARKLEKTPEFKANRKEKITILDRLVEEPVSRSQIYEEKDIDHRRLLNHVLSLKSEDLIEEKGDSKLEITEKGRKILEKQKSDNKEKLKRIENIANSDLRFIKIEEINEKSADTVYDFTTESETFIAEDIVVHNTTLLDRIRESRIVEGEEGGITQMIGATEIPLETIEDVCGDLLNQLDTDITIPGMLFIDTPGHAAFSSLRKRGGSISDIAIVVVDAQNGIQPQTEEALKILQDTNTPFIIALNKIDTIPGWRSEHNLFTKNLQEQTDKVQGKLDEEIYSLMGDLHDQTGVTAERFDRVDDFQKKAAIVPISAMTGEGLPELLMTLTGLSQNYLQDQLEVEEDSTGKGTVLEVTKEKGLGTTLDIIHYDGQIKKDDTLVYGTQDGVKTTDIRSLLQPRPLQEIRLDKQYSQVDKINPASGVKISGKDLEGAIAGAPVRTTQENIEEVKEEVLGELETMSFETQNEGIMVKADSLGSLEALMREIEGIPVQEAKVGPVKKNDVVKVQNEEPENRAIFAFNVEATAQAEDMIEDKGIQLFQNQVIYKIVEDYNEWKEMLEKKQQEQALEKIPRPGKIQLMPQHIFNQAKPAVIGAKVKKGVIKPETALMNKQGDKVGRIKAIQEQNESIDKASKGAEIAVSISGATVGRTFEDDEVLYVDLTGKQYRQLQHLDEHLSKGEKQVLEEIVDIKDSKDPHWKIG